MSTPSPHHIDNSEVENTRWRIDPARSSIEFRVHHFYGLQTINGRFERYNGIFQPSRDPAIELTIEAASVNTNNPQRDKHLRSTDFFDVENHPLVRFVSDSVALEDERLKVRGRLYAAGKSISLEIDADLRRDGDELELDATTLADHRQLGMTWGPFGIVRTPSKLIVHGRLIQDAE